MTSRMAPESWPMRTGVRRPIREYGFVNPRDEYGGRMFEREWPAGPARHGGSRPISRVLSWAAIHLGHSSRCASSNLPGSRADHTFEEEPRCPPIWSCSGRGLPCRLRYRRRGALLPHHFTLTPLARGQRGGIFSVALAVGLRLPGVTWRPVLWSPDFPPSRESRNSGCLANSWVESRQVRGIWLLS